MKLLSKFLLCFLLGAAIMRGALPPPATGGSVHLEIQAGSKSKSVNVSYLPPSGNTAYTSILSAKVTNTVTAVPGHTPIHRVDEFILNEDLVSSTRFIDDYQQFDPNLGDFYPHPGYGVRFRSIKLEQTERTGEINKKDYIFTATFDVFQQSDNSWADGTISWAGTSTTGFKGIFPVTDGIPGALAPACYLEGLTSSSYSGPQGADIFQDFSETLIEGETSVTHNYRYLFAILYYYAGTTIEADGSRLVYEASFQDAVGFGYLQTPVGKLTHVETGGDFTTPLEPAAAYSQLQGLTWTQPAELTSAGGTSAEYLFNPTQASASKLFYQIKFRPDSPRIFWQETFTPTGASTPSDTVWLSYDPQDPQENVTPLYTVDPFATSNSHRFGITPGQYRVVLLDALSSLAVDANTDGRIALLVENQSDAVDPNHPYVHAPNLNHDGGGATSDAEDPGVNGAADLRDFFPVFLDIKQLLEVHPPGAAVHYKLKQGDAALNFVYTNLTRSAAMSYKGGTLATGFGALFDHPAASAPTVPVPEIGFDIFAGSPAFLDAILHYDGGVILVEGKRFSDKPLVLEISDGASTIITEVPLPLSISPLQVVSRDRFLAGSLELPDGLDGVELEFVNTATGENLGSYGELTGGGATKIYSAVTDILSDADLEDGGQPDSQTVWFVRAPSNPNRIEFYTCFNDAGTIEVRVKRDGVRVFTRSHTLVPAEDFAGWINYVDNWVKGVGFEFLGDTETQGLRFSMNSFGSSGPATGLSNLTRACLIPLFNVVTQTEGLEAVVLGAYNGARTGLTDDWESIKLIAGLGLDAGTWGWEQARDEIRLWRDHPIKRASELKQLTDQLCSEYVFRPSQQALANYSSWESFAKYSWETWNSVRDGAPKVFTLTQSIGSRVGAGLLSWGDDFAARMLQGGELVAFQNTPWGTDPILADFAQTNRQASYTFGYVSGYLTEQVAIGAVTAGSAKFAQVITKGGLRFASSLSARTIFEVGGHLQQIKQVLKSATFSALLATQVELGLGKAARTPIDQISKQSVAQVIEDVFSRPGFDRNAFNAKLLIQNIEALPRQRALFETVEEGWMLFHKTARLAQVEAEAVTAKGMANWQKVFENLLPLQPNDLERAEDFFRIFKPETEQGRIWLKETLEALDTKSATQILDEGLKVSSKIKEVYPTLYHYADGNTLLGHATVQPDGKWLLEEFRDGRYVSPLEVSSKSAARDTFQLPVGNATKGRFKCIIRTSDVSEDLRIPRSIRHQDGVDERLAWLEAYTKDNSRLGAGGGPQFVQTKEVLVEVLDLDTGQFIRTQADLEAALAIN